MNIYTHNDIGSFRTEFQNAVISGSIFEVVKGTRLVSTRQKRLKTPFPNTANVDDLTARVRLWRSQGIYWKNHYPDTIDPDVPDLKKEIDEAEQLYVKRGFKEKPESIAYRDAMRARKQVGRIVYSNAGRYLDPNGNRIPLKMLTLTFKSVEYADLPLANKRFTKMMRSMDTEFRDDLLGKKLMYVATHELQKRGVIHYHVLLFNFPYIQKMVYSRLRKLWISDSPQIHLSVYDTDEARSIAVSYLSKYIVKQVNDERYFGKKRYMTSKGLLRPFKTQDSAKIGVLETAFGDRLIQTYDFDFEFASGSVSVYYLPNWLTVDHALKLPQWRDKLDPVQQELNEAFR